MLMTFLCTVIMKSMKQQKFSLSDRLKSFLYAFNGLKTMFREEHNSRIHFAATVGVLIASVIFKISAYEWIAVVLSIGFVFSSELMNSAIEQIADFISPARNEKIRVIKDFAAAGVLLSAITAFIVGLVIFLPRLILFF